MSVSKERQEIIEKLMRTPSYSSTEEYGNIKEKKDNVKKQLIKKTWNDLNKFLFDNSGEVYQKLKGLEQEIWAKLILMEKDCRIMKAYLRFPTININGGFDDFDGLQVGLARFTSHDNDSSTYISSVDGLLYQLKGGLDIKIDAIGNIFMRKNTSVRIVTTSIFDTHQTVELGKEYLKVFDLRKFKKKLSKLIKDGEKDVRILAKYTFIMITIGTEEMYNSNIFGCDIWLALIHIIAVEMIEVILKEEEKECCQISTVNTNIGNFCKNKESVLERNGVIKAAFINKNEKKIENDIFIDRIKDDVNNFNILSSGLKLKSYNILSSPDTNNNINLQQKFNDNRELLFRNHHISSSKIPIITTGLLPQIENSLSSTSSGVSSSGSGKILTTNINFKDTSNDTPPIRLCRYRQHYDEIKDSNLLYPYNNSQINNEVKVKNSEPGVLVKSKKSRIKDDWICHQPIVSDKKNKIRSKSVFNEKKKFEKNILFDNDSLALSYDKEDSTNYLAPSEPIKRLAKWKSEKSLFF
ncbi:SMAD domain, Dwarfin-type and SMAD/FHA domain and SMAD domain-like-containing protein [Strongyloides ratti]|uniref:SMAD domain, Dwarfin-type and SMAD/FHA domain and SMAD domain-like-containing protein n=1 Tax=Strongyloides ratti TaxID=34506 RepID=A0A090LKE3_STRRB|nr:SMAD domain, Dwarfin-type and SMAD/FHA domain and SMAD domain-like-containing protein [Strongyloides ratti]CEF70257.1 SMAD domain, Dwarfin-type and SMAD/FHA domain and SMAD domain-like-containing protein [Strongyloides ratti]